MAQPILPFALPLVVCDGYESAAAGKLDIVGSFHTIRPLNYPHVHDRFCVVGHLTGGMGSVTFHLDIRNTETGELVYCTNPHSLRIASRKKLVRLANSLEGVTFSLPGIYLIELYCENAPIADSRLELIEVEEKRYRGTAMKPSDGSRFTSGEGSILIEIVSKPAPITPADIDRARRRAQQLKAQEQERLSREEDSSSSQDEPPKQPE